MMKIQSKKNRIRPWIAAQTLLIFALIAPALGYAHSGHDPLNARDWQAIAVLDNDSLPCCTTDELAAIATALAKGTEEMAKVINEAKPIATSNTDRDQMQSQLRNSLHDQLSRITEQLYGLSKTSTDNPGKSWLAVTRDLSTALPLMASMSSNGFDGKWTQITMRLLPRLFDRVLLNYVESDHDRPGEKS